MRKQPFAAISGLGFSRISRAPIGSSRDLAREAVNAAARDAGLRLRDIDGLLIGRSPSAPLSDLPLKIRDDLDLGALTLLSSVEGEGTTAIQMIQQAAMAIKFGFAKRVMCVFADAPLKPGAETGSAAFRRVMALTGIDGWEARYGMFGAAGAHALAARRYMNSYGLTEEHLGAYVLSNRKWAERNPQAAVRKPLTLDDYLTTRYVVEPFRTLDCAYPVNGAIAVLVTDASRAAESPRPPVFIHGVGQGHLGQPGLQDIDRSLSAGGLLAGQRAYAMAGIKASDVDVCQFYDAFSYVGLLSLEDYGLCERGEAGEVFRSGRCSPGGALPVNTGGGHLSGFYLQGMTPISEAIMQVRGDGGQRQVEKRDIVLVTGVGGCLDYHAALVCSPLKSLG